MSDRWPRQALAQVPFDEWMHTQELQITKAEEELAVRTLRVQARPVLARAFLRQSAAVLLAHLPVCLRCALTALCGMSAGAQERYFHTGARHWKDTQGQRSIEECAPEKRRSN